MGFSIIKEIAWFNTQTFRNLLQARGAHPVFAVLVFLNLLECDVAVFAEVLLGLVHLDASELDTLTHQAINFIELILHTGFNLGGASDRSWDHDCEWTEAEHGDRRRPVVWRRCVVRRTVASRTEVPWHALRPDPPTIERLARRRPVGLRWWRNGRRCYRCRCLIVQCRLIVRPIDCAMDLRIAVDDLIPTRRLDRGSACAACKPASNSTPAI